MYFLTKGFLKIKLLVRCKKSKNEHLKFTIFRVEKTG